MIITQTQILTSICKHYFAVSEAVFFLRYRNMETFLAVPSLQEVVS